MTDLDTAQKTSRSPITYLQTGLSLLAATILGFRAARTANGQGVPELDTTSHVLAALVVGSAAGLAVAAAVLLLAGNRRPAAAALTTTLVMELLVLGAIASPPRLVTALPLGLALALFLASRPGRAVAGGGTVTAPATGSSRRTAAAVVSLLLMLPVGFLYLMSGLVVPVPDLFGMYALFAALFAGAALLARRRSWWVLAVPPLSAGLWFLLITIGGRFWGWQP